MKAHMTFLVLILSMTACMGPEAKSKAAAEHAAKADALLQRATSVGEKDGDRDEIVAELRKAVGLRPGDPTYHYKLAWRWRIRTRCRRTTFWLNIARRFA